MTQPGDPKSSSTGRPGDDLRKIDGVGRRFEQRLWDAGIFTYRDLAQRTPEEIAAVLAPMAGISPERISSQARELAGSPPEAPVPRQHYAAFHVEFLLESDNSVRRTKVHQHQTDARDAWPGQHGEITSPAHRVHARVEDAIRTGKDCGIGKYPSTSLAMNKAWQAAALTAAALLAWLRLLALDGHLARAEPKTLRYRILHAAARLARGGRRRRLKIDASWPWAAWNRISALPQAP